jgi:hypothetical protein
MSESAAPMNQGRHAIDSTGPLVDSESPKLIGGDSFVKRTQNPK